MDDWQKYLIKGDPLTDAQKRDADTQNAHLAVRNELYLQAHPELKRSISLLTHAILESRPANPAKFACDFFSRPELAEELSKQ